MESRALVGRDRELLAFDDALRAVCAGERTVLILSGEPGIGKTRLLEELAARMLARGGSAAWGRTWEVGVTPPFWPFIEALSALETPADRAPALGTLEERAHHAAQLARFAEVAEFLKRRAQHTAVAVLLDDMHTADASSLQLLEHVLPRLLGQRILFGLTLRDELPRPDIRAALGRIQRSALRLPLARLARPDVQRLVEARLTEREPHAMASASDRVFALSEGNPLFVEELLASLHGDGTLRLPALSSVRELVRARIAALPEPSVAALVAASVVGREFRGEVIAHMLDESAQPSRADTQRATPLSLEALGPRLQPVLQLALISMTGPDRYRFSHALVAEAIADGIDPSERARLHLCAAQAAQRVTPEDRGAIAHHLLAAGHLAADAAVRAAEAAAEQCSAQLAFEDAAALLERALQALELAAPDDALRRAHLLCARAEALQHAARHSAARELCERAATIARTLPGETGSELSAKIALVRGLEYRFGRTDPLLSTALREALDHLGEHAPPALRPRLLARLAAAEQPSPDPFETARRAWHAIELGKQLALQERMDVAYVASAALVDFSEPEQLEELQREILAWARGRDRSISVHTLLRLCFTALDRVDRPGFDARVAEFSAAAAQLGLPRWTSQVPMLHALTGLLEGRFEDAAAAARESAEISSALADTGAAWLMDVHCALSASIRTAPLDRAIAARLRDYAPGRAPIQAWFGVLDGDREAARAGLAAVDVRAPTAPDLGSMVASAVLFVEDASLAARLYEVLQPRSGRIVLAGMVGMAVMDLYDRLLLGLAALCGRWQDVTRHAERALLVASSLGSPVWAARTRADWAAALERRARQDGSDAPDEARALWASALATAERLGMPGLEARSREALAAYPAASASRSRERQHDRDHDHERAPVVLQREGELWRVQGFGASAHVKDSRGLQLIARLVAEPDRELHVLDLVGTEGVVSSDTGPQLDARARAAYSARIAELNAERDAASQNHDLGQLERVSRELETLERELARAFGLGGRARAAGSTSERARSNVQRRIAHAIAQLRAASPELAAHLSQSIRTGTYCVYAPGGHGRD